jgi:hypothetical protein
MKYYFAIGAMFKDEGPYLHEWVAFHLARGAEHFYLYDNGSSDNSLTVLEPFIKRGEVTLIHWPAPITEGSQTHAANDALRRAKVESKWLTFIDIDEFLFSPKEHLPEILREYEDEVGIEVNWVCYGSSRRTSTPAGSVRDSFLYRAPLQWGRNRQFKCIVKTEAASEKRHSDHLWNFSDRRRSVNERREPLGRRHSVSYRLERWLRNHFPQLHRRASWRLPLLLNPYFHINRPVSAERFRINHYIVKSAQEYTEKKIRHGQHRDGAYSDAFFRYHDRNEVYDPIIAELDQVS